MKPYTGQKPIPGYDDSEQELFEAELRSEYRDNRGSREPFENAPDDEYFPVPEVLDEP